VIEVEGVTKRFGSLVAVNDVSLEVHEGEIFGMLGHNGAGKTTLIRVVNGLLDPDAGRIRVAGLDPVTDGHAVRRITGVLTEYPALDEYLTSTENLRVYAAINRVLPEDAERRIAELQDQLGLSERAHEPTRGLSAGLKQRVALARAMVHDPTILLLDEPTTNMDPIAARTVRRLIVEAVRDRSRTVLLSTHNLAEAEELCDRVGILRNGRLLAVGAPGALRRELGVSRGVRVESRQGGAEAILDALPSGSTAERVDDVTVQLNGALPIPHLVARLVQHGVPLDRVDPIEPSLEDLYVHLHAHDDGPDPPLPRSEIGS
jgi:ABC-2 type transport system ATP-binding protein